MALVDEGTLDLDEPVGSYLDGAPLTSDEPPVDMTLRQLLSMSSGLDNGPYTDHGRGADALGQYVALTCRDSRDLRAGDGVRLLERGHLRRRARRRSG